jgi:hypothetical protein
MARCCRIVCKWTITIAIAVALSGCMTGTSNVKVDRDSKVAPVGGIHYSLPQPYLLATPGIDGTLIVYTLFLPDPEHEYSVTTSSFLSQCSFNVTTVGGLLTLNRK